MQLDAHENFRELCIALAVGDITHEDRLRLHLHLNICSDCRAAFSQYKDVVEEILPSLAAAHSSLALVDVAESWSVESGEQSLLKVVAQNNQGETFTLNPLSEPCKPVIPGVRVSGNSRSADKGVPFLRGFRGKLQHAFAYAAALVVVVAGLGLAVYQMGVRHEPAKLSKVPLQVNASVNSQARTPSNGRSAAVEHEKAVLDSERDTLASELHTREAEVATLTKKLQDQIRLNASLAAGAAAANEQIARTIQQGQSDREALDQKLKQSQESLLALQHRMDVRDEDRAGANFRIIDLQTTVNSLSAHVKQQADQLAERDATVQQQRELLASDRDIRELMGARDLYIAEVYDLARDGKKQKPYGRMFYTKDRSLVFYGYDLDQQPGVTSASTFQAWGQRGASRKDALNLGILYVDSAAKKRWAVRFDDPKVLAEIDAVFITVEHGKESRSPSGKPLLTAYLHIQPNHP